MNSPDLSLVLACYNEENILERSVSEIFQVLDALRWTSEVIFVDDASRDRTKDIIDRILRENPTRNCINSSTLTTWVAAAPCRTVFG
jgi:polyisoprenyl-phosphate glycosyltransferase